jgi:hypothetical protein
MIKRRLRRKAKRKRIKHKETGFLLAKSKNFDSMKTLALLSKDERDAGIKSILAEHDIYQ